MHEAVVEEVSVIRHMIGQENWQPRRIASVRTSDGPRMTVGLRDESGPGATIELFEEGTAPFGRAKNRLVARRSDELLAFDRRKRAASHAASAGIPSWRVRTATPMQNLRLAFFFPSAASSTACWSLSPCAFGLSPDG